jgi:tryptophan-rich sensory protein
MGSFIVFLGLVAAAALIGGQFQTGAWYETLRKPPWTPPDGVFPIVWSVLYVAIAVAGWRVWRSRGAPRRTTALALWAAQLVLNAAWSWLFFGLHRPGWALADLIALLAVVGGFITAAGRSSRLASWIFLVYAAWLCFAAALNGAIWSLNRGD